jgi:hypothetical protein
MSKILLTLVAILVVFFAVRYLVEGFTNTELSMREFHETARPPYDLPERDVSPGGPSSPNAALPVGVIPTTFSPPEEPHDPYHSTEGQLSVEDSMRYPERSFGPGSDNTNTQIAVASGVASQNTQQVQNSFRIFGPENAQTGGYVDQDVVANDTLDDRIYSPF